MELFSPEWMAALTAIVVIDLLLAGDNAIVIALAARNLPPVWKRRAVIYGTMGAIVARVVLALFISQLLRLPGLGVAGGLLLYVIAWRLLNKKEEPSAASANSFWSAMLTIIVADTVMGLDNVLAIAAAARGDVWLIVIGLALSIPIMMGGSMIILRALEKAPWLTVVGSGLLSLIAGRIILDDKWLRQFVDWPAAGEWAAVALLAALITAAALWRAKKTAAPAK